MRSYDKYTRVLKTLLAPSYVTTDNFKYCRFNEMLESVFANVKTSSRNSDAYSKNLGLYCVGADVTSKLLLSSRQLGLYSGRPTLKSGHVPCTPQMIQHVLMTLMTREGALCNPLYVICKTCIKLIQI
jgi:hypothetical protein